MMIYISFKWNSVEEEFPQYLEKNDLYVIHKGRIVHGCKYPREGMALKHKSGVTMRVVRELKNYENYSHDFALAANNIHPQDISLFRK